MSLSPVLSSIPRPREAVERAAGPGGAAPEATSGSVTVGRPRDYLGLDTPPESSSQLVRVLPTLGRPPAAPHGLGISAGRDGRPRFLGLPLPAWVLVAGVSIVTIIGALVILPRLGRANAPPPVSAVDDYPPSGVGIGVIGNEQQPAPGAPGAGGSGSSGPVSGAPVSGAPGGATTPPGGATTGPGGATTLPDTPPLDIQLVTGSVLNLGVLGWSVTVTIRNPASVAQEWTNVSVQVNDGLPLQLGSVSPGVQAYESARRVCVQPSGPRSVSAHSSLTIDFRINSALSQAPGPARLNDTACLPLSDA